VVFGASNFPFAISVAGTDTVSALGAGCPVIVKAHPAHPGTCEMIAGAVVKALEQTGMPAGAFSMVHGTGIEIGMALVKHPLAAVVAFTGSLRGGRALFDAAASRKNPIPFYGELGSVNPVFLLPGALKERAPQMAEAYVGSADHGRGTVLHESRIGVWPGRRRAEQLSWTKPPRSSKHGLLPRCCMAASATPSMLEWNG